MPNLSSIQEFAREIKRLAREPEILRRRGEPVDEPALPAESGPEATPTEAAPPEPSSPPEAPPVEQEAPGGESPFPEEEGLPPDLDQLLAGLGEEPEEATAPEEAFSPEEPAPSDEPEIPEQPSSPEEAPAGGEELPSDAFLDEFLRASDLADESEMTSLDESTEQPGASDEGFPSEDLFGGEEELPLEEGPSPVEEASERAPSEEADEAAPEGPVAAPPASAPSAGDEEPPDDSLFFEVPSFEDLEPPAEASGITPEPSEPSGEEGGADSLQGFDDLGDLGDLGAEPPAAEERTPEGLGDFGEPDVESLEGLGDLGDLGAEPPAAEEPPTEAPQAPDDFEFPEEFGSFDEPAPSEEPSEDIGLPDELGSLEELGVPDELGLPEEPAEGEPDLGLPEEFAPPEEPEVEAGGQETDLPAEEIPTFEEPTIPEGTEEFELPAFDEEGLAEELPVEEELAPPEAPSAAGGEEPVPPPTADSEELDDIGLGDIGEEFGLTEGGEGQSEEDLNPALAVGGGLAPEIEAGPSGAGAPEPTELSERDFQKIQETLSSLPRNLRLPIEELIGEQDLAGRQLATLVALLVRGAPPREIATATSRIVGRKIEIPAAYEKKSGLEFEEERGTFAYRFRHNILPILRVFVAAAAVIALIIFLGYRFVYQPIHAYSLYAQGYGQLKADNFVTANRDFSDASRVWEMKGWYYRYADGYIAKKQYAFAADKFDSLLSLWPGDRKAIFDYAAMETKHLGDYKKANQLLDVILNKNMWDYQGLLQAGDNYLAWGAEDSSKYELARRDYAMLLQHYGTSNLLLFRMLRYFIKTDNLKQVELLKNQFQDQPKITVDPIAYAELGGYLIDKNQLNDVHSILFRALKADPTLPETNYNLARYFKRVGDYGQESVALQKTLADLQRDTPLTRARLGMLIDTYDRIGESLYRKKSYLQAEQAYLKGINRYEAALKQDQLKPSAEFGRLYANLGDVNYYHSGNLKEALRLYLKAEANDYKTPELHYREAYVYYHGQDYQKALMKFYDAAGSFSDNWDLMYATANTLYERNDYFAAEGYYINLLNMLEQRRQSITTFQPDVIPAHHDLLVNLMKVYNNLGVTLDQLSKRSSDSQKYSQALVNLTHSMEAFDKLTRNPITKQKSNAINLAFINTKNILYPTPNYQLQIYSDLPQDMNGKSF